MRLPHHLVRHCSGVFHFRLIVPVDLRARVRRRVIKRSLRTKDPRVAMLAALMLAAGYAQLFARARRSGMADEFDLDALIREMEARGAIPKKFEIGMRDGEPFFKSDPGESLEQTQAGMALFTELMARRFDATASALPTPTSTALAPTTPVVARSVRAAITHWEAVEMPVMRKRNTGTADACLAAMNDFAAYVGEERMISDLRTADVSAWALYRIASRKNQHSTVKNRAGHIKALFDSAKRAGAYPREWENPALDPVKFTKADQEARAKTHGWQAFTEAQLKTLFDPEALRQTRMVHVRRAMVIALYTGARVGEIAQLRLDKFPKVDGRRCMSFAGDTKNDAAKRLIPIHPDLIKLGLLQWVAQQKRRKETRLFPTVKLDGKSGKGNALSKGMGNLLPRLGIKPTIDPALVELGKEVDPILGMHSFRDNVIQAMQGKVEMEIRKAYVGHSYEGQEKYRQKDSHEVAYMRDWTPDEIAKVFGAIAWGKWLDFDGVGPLLAQSDAEHEKDMKTKTMREATRSATAASAAGQNLKKRKK